MKKSLLSLFIASLFSAPYSAMANNNSEVSYSYSNDNGTPIFAITNTTNAPVAITKIEFDLNANMNGAPWGSLFLWDDEIERSLNADQQSYHYVIFNKKQSVIVNPNETKDLRYSFDSVLGVFDNLPMDPNNVKITLADNSTVELPITDHCVGDACKDPSPRYSLMGYYADWTQYAHNYNAKDIPVNKINRINYAFINYETNGTVKLYDAWADQKQLPTISQLRKKYPYLNASLSFGGWTLSYNFSALAADSNARALFAKNAVRAMKQVNFNGIDIDWEFPVANGAPGEPSTETPQDGVNFVALLQDLRSELDKQGKIDGTHYDLSIAVSAGVDKIDALERVNPGAWKKVAAAIDHLNLMTYDLHGSFDASQPAPYNVSNFMAAMQLDPQNDPTAKNATLSKYNVTDSVQLYKDVGIKPQQIVVGVPLYGRMSNISSVGDKAGLYSIITGTPAGEFDDSSSGATGMFDYKCIVDNSFCYGTSANTLSGLVLVDYTTNPLGNFAKTPWGYNPNKNQFITYDDVKSMAYKANWVKENQLGGIMVWELDGDLPASHPSSMISKAQEILVK